MKKIKEEKFEEFIEEALKEFPKKILKEIKNLTICVEDEPTPFQLEKLGKRKNFLILGLYEGYPQIKRGKYAQVLPDKITIFRKPIERVAKTEKEIKEIVRRTVWHEIGHHFGLNEEEITKIQAKKFQK